MATVYKGILFAVPPMDQTAAKLQKGHIHGVACSMLLDLVLNAPKPSATQAFSPAARLPRARAACT